MKAWYWNVHFYQKCRKNYFQMCIIFVPNLVYIINFNFFTLFLLWRKSFESNSTMPTKAVFHIEDTLYLFLEKTVLYYEDSFIFIKI